MQRPQAPAAFQQPGAGNVLDPAVRGELRDKMQQAVHGVGPKGQGTGQGEAQPPQNDEASADAPAQPETAQAAAAEPAKPEPAQTYRAGPFPHGDVDLRGHKANVPSEPVRPNRGKQGRRFYFLADKDQEGQPQTHEPKDGPKPG